MKTILTLVTIGGILCCCVFGDTPSDQYTKAQLKNRQQYRANMAALLIASDRVEILFLDKKDQLFPDAGDRMSTGHGMTVKVISKRDLKADASRKIIAATVKLIKGKVDTKIDNFNPRWVGIRSYKGRKMIFEFVVSIEGNAFLIRYPDHDDWIRCSKILTNIIQAQQDVALDG